MAEVYTMSNKELKRLKIIEQLHEKQLKQKQAAKILELSTRQIRNLLKEFQQNGPEGLISKRRGQPSNRRYKNAFKERVMVN